MEKVLYSGYTTTFIACYTAAIASRKMTESIYGNGYTVNDRADAFRHAYWNALSTNHIGSNLTRLFTNAHEYGIPENFVGDAYLSTVMDLNNNAVGRDIGSRYRSENYVKVLSGTAIENRLKIVLNGRLVPANRGYSIRP